MAYPQDSAPITEFLIGGVWTDIASTNAVRADSGITITRGRANEQGTVGPQTSSFSVNNRNGRFSTRNPNSPHYGLLPRNTQVRHRAGDGDNHMWMPWNDQPSSSGLITSDKAVLDVVGDIEVRADIWPHTWRPVCNPGQGGGSMVIASKWRTSTASRSWLLYLFSNGLLAFAWSADGTTVLTAFSTAAIPITTGRLSIKVTLDVDNGASGRTVSFATSTTIGGTYTALGSAVTTAGVTSIFSSDANLWVGGSDTGTGVGSLSGGYQFGGKFYELQVRNSIGGTLVANPIFGNQGLGAGVFSDGLGTPNSWAIQGVARIISDRMRYVGELSKLPQVWDQSARDFIVPVSSGGLLQRLSATGQVLDSAMTRAYKKLTASGYWPLEDDSGSQTAVSPIAGVAPATLSAVTMGNGGGAGGLPGATGVATFGDSSTGTRIIFTPKRVTATPTLFFMFFVKLPSPLPATGKNVAQFYGTGSVRRIDIGISTAGWQTDFLAKDGTVLATNTTSFTSGPFNINPSLRWIGLNVLMTESAGTISWSIRWLGLGDSTFSGIGPFTFAGTTGIWTSAQISAKTAIELQGMQLAHVFMSSADVGFVTSAIRNAMNAYNLETAAARIDRLCTEEGIDKEIVGQWNRTAMTGYQTADTFLNLIQSAAAADGGILAESRSMLALTYRCAADLETRRDLTLDESLFHLTDPPLPSEDDQNFANDITMSRTGGSSARDYVAGSGYHQLSVQPPPAGAGTVTGGGSVNVATDDQLTNIASWKAHVQSWDEPRFPNVKLSLHRTVIGVTSLAAQVRALDLGDTISLTHLPAIVMPPDDVQVLAQGYTETLKRSLWDITFNTSPAGPYRTGRYDQADLAGTTRYTTAGSTVSTAVNTTVTTLVLAYSTVGDNWTTAGASYPFNITVEGEVITLNTPPGGSTSPQTFTGVTRSVNGIVKAHGVGAVVELFDTDYYSL